MNDDDARMVQIHIVEDNGRGSESLFEVDLLLDRDVDKRLQAGEHAAFREVLGRAKKLIHKFNAER